MPVVVDGTLAAIVSIGDIVKHRIDELPVERDQLVGYIQQYASPGSFPSSASEVAGIVDDTRGAHDGRAAGSRTVTAAGRATVCRCGGGTGS